VNWQAIKADLKARNEFRLTDAQRLDPKINRLGWIINGLVALVVLFVYACDIWHQLYP